MVRNWVGNLAAFRLKYGFSQPENTSAVVFRLPGALHGWKSGPDLYGRRTHRWPQGQTSCFYLVTH